jgi:FlaA1/EpsC-like NDP-sugar epimerase
MRVLILGAGGHGQVIADILLCMAENGQKIQPAGYLDDDVALVGQELLGIPVLGRLDNWVFSITMQSYWG